MVAKDDCRPNLVVVDEAFGPRSDLYIDVLQVQPNAGTGQIQDAYFDRRNELFQLLADIDGDNEQDSITESHRRSAERKMDAVVCSVRILGDPDLRLQYDDMRTERLQAAPSRGPRKPRRPAASSSRPVATVVDDPADDPTAPDDEAQGDRRQPPSSSSQSSVESVEHDSAGRYRSRSNKNALDPPISSDAAEYPSPQQQQKQQLPPRKPRVVSPEIPARRTPDKIDAGRRRQQQAQQLSKRTTPQLQESFDNDTLGSETIMSEDGNEDETFFSYDDDDASISESILRKTAQKPKGLFDRIRLEAIGACDDTARSFAQVCNVFTLQEDDIRAVMGRIDKASRQLHEGVPLPPGSGSASGSRSSRSRRTPPDSSGRKSPAASIGRRTGKSSAQR